MSTLHEVWLQLGVDTADREHFFKFLDMLSIKLDDNEKENVFTILDIDGKGKLSYDDIRIFLKMTSVYDKTKYPKTNAQRRKSYKIYPE